MSDPEEIIPEPVEGNDTEERKLERFPELKALEDDIRRRLRSNQRFLERFMDEDFVDLDDGGEDDDPDDPGLEEEL